jgi:hypothetical protein
MGQKERSMIPYDVDPSLHRTQPRDETLGDGFSPPPPQPVQPPEPAITTPQPPPVEPLPGDKSVF